MKNLKIGIIGAGKMALWHIRAYKKIPSVKIMAIANPNSKRGKKLAKRYNISEHYKDGFQLIDDADIDAVDICVPTKFHKEYILKALNKGLHVYSEKPMCTSEKEYIEVINANKRKKKIIFNGFNYRFIPEFCKIRSIIKSGKLGHIRHIHFFRSTKEKPDSYIFKYGSGLFNEFHCHFVDLLFSFGFNNPDSVFAYGTNVHQWNINPDTGTMILTYPDKMLVEITTSLAFQGVSPELLIVGTKGTLRLRYGNILVTCKKDIWKLHELLLWMFRDSITLPFRVLKNTLKGSCSYFVNCVINNRNNDCNEYSALKVFRITSAAEQSYKKKTPLSLVRTLRRN